MYFCTVNLNSKVASSDLHTSVAPIGNWLQSLLPYRVHRACYNSMEWLRCTSVHQYHQMLCECVKCRELISYDEIALYKKYPLLLLCHHQHSLLIFILILPHALCILVSYRLIFCHIIFLLTPWSSRTRHVYTQSPQGRQRISSTQTSS